VVAAVDVERLAGDETRSVVCQEGGGDADILDADEAARGRLRFRLVEQGVEFGYIPEAARVASGPGEMARTRMPFGPSSTAMQRSALSTGRHPTDHDKRCR
jgi:hypothetical protein